MTLEEYRQAVIDTCKKEYGSFCTKWEKELKEAIDDWDKTKAFESAYESGFTVESQAHCLMMCI